MQNELPNIIARYYQTKSDLRRLADDAKLNTMFIKMEDSAINVAGNIIRAAERQDKKEKLLEVIVNNYPTSMTAMDMIRFLSKADPRESADPEYYRDRYRERHQEQPPDEWRIQLLADVKANSVMIARMWMLMLVISALVGILVIKDMFM